MIVKTFYLFAALLFTNYLNAQTQENKKTAKEKTREIYLHKNPDKGFSENTVPIAEINIIQTIPDSTRLGYATRGFNTIAVTAIPDKPLTEYFQSYLNRKYLKSYDKEGLHLLWLIKNIRVNQSSGAFLYFNADAYMSKDGKAYSFSAGLDTVLVKSSMTGDIHYLNIKKAFDLLLQKSIDKGKEFIIADTTNSFLTQQILLKEQQKFNWPIYTDSIYKGGIYKDFKEFLNNSPSINDLKPVVINKNRIVVITNQKDTVVPWGICEKGEFYKFDENKLIPIEKQGNEFIMSDYISVINKLNKNKRNSGLYPAVGRGFGNDLIVLGGEALGLLLSKKMSEKIIMVTSISYLETQPEACTIDMRNGEWFF